jgi:hypothetical protein
MGATIVSEGEHLAALVSITARIVIEAPSKTTKQGGSVSGLPEHGGS